MKRYTQALTLAATLLIASLAMAQNGAERAGALPPASLQQTRGVVFYTAAINGSTAAIASCFGCKSAAHLGTGLYQVLFSTNVQAINGYSRWVQADTLTTGTTNAYCTTADRSGSPTGVWVQCQNASGPVDTNFFLFVAR